MRRPLIETALLLWFGILSIKLFGLLYAVAGGLGLALVLKLDYFYPQIQQRSTIETSRQDGFVEAGVICLIVLIGALYFQLYESKILKLENVSGNQQVVGVVMHTSKSETIIEKAYLIRGSGSKSYLGRVKIEDDWKGTPGSLVCLTGEVKAFQPARNPNGFSSRTYYLSKGVILSMVSVSENDEIEVLTQFDIRGLSALSIRVSQFKNRLGAMLCTTAESQIDKLYPPAHAAMLKGILVGKTSVLNESVIKAFRTTGTAHILAVSGLHFATVYAGLHLFMKTIRAPKRLATGFIFLSMALFLLITGVSVSGMRAFTMIVLHQVAKQLNRRYDLLNALGVAALVSILMSPYTVWSIGFQLSFWAVFSIGFFQKMTAVNDTFKKYDLLFLPLAIQIGLAVLSISTFNKFYPYALLYNLPVLAMTPFVILTGALSVIFSALPIISAPMAFICSGMLEALEILTQSVLSLPLHTLNVVNFSAPRMIIFYMVMAMLCLSFSFRQRMKRVHISVVIVTLVFILFVPMRTSAVTVDFLDVGQGDATLIKRGDGRAILIDSGPAYTDLEQILLKEGVKRLDAVYVSHPDSDHISGVLNLPNQFEIDRVYYGLLSEKKDAVEDLMDKRPNTAFVQLKRGTVITWGNTCIRVLSPMTEMQGKALSANDMSLVLLVDIDGYEILFTGDIESEVETELALLNARQNAPFDIDVLKVAHHGSKTSTEQVFLQSFMPEYAVIQVGRNWYGHPSDETLKILQKEDVQAFRNDQQGCIRLMIENGEPIWTPWLTMLY